MLWKDAFLKGAVRAFKAGFDIVELHAAHGYGLNQWLSPITNLRKDSYDLKLADHYSKWDEDDQKNYSEKIMEHIRKTVQKEGPGHASFENVVSLQKFKKASNN